MFKDIDLSIYDLDNDFHRACFFRDCLKGDIYFYNEDEEHYVASTWGLVMANRFEIGDASGTVVEHKVTTLKINELLYFVMITAMKYIDEETKKVEKEIEEWEEKARKELAGCGPRSCYPEPYREWEEKNPFKQSNPHFSTNVGRAFNHRFKTVVSIKETLNDLQIILEIPDGEGEHPESGYGS
tara:strand:- start:154 stop:705 length:552 start_codon:yes stop_codon:yes gene_type:complete